MKKQFLNILYAFAFCLGSSNLIVSSHEEALKPEAPKAVETDTAEQRRIAEEEEERRRAGAPKSIGHEQGISGQVADAAGQARQRVVEGFGQARDAAVGALDSAKDAAAVVANQAAKEFNEQANDARAEAIKEVKDQAQLQWEEAVKALGFDSDSVTDIPSLAAVAAQLAVRKSIEVIVAKCKDFISSIKTYWNMRQLMNSLIKSAKDPKVKLDVTTAEFKKNYNSLPPDRKTQVAQALLEKNIEFIKEKTESDIKEASEKVRVTIIKLNNEINNLSKTPADVITNAAAIKKINDNITNIGNVLVITVAQLKLSEPDRIKESIQEITTALQPDQKDSKTKGQVLVSIPETLTQKEVAKGKLPKTTFEIIDINDIDLKNPLVEVKNDKRIPVEEAPSFFKSLFGKAKIDSLIVENSLAKYFADTAKLNSKTVEELELLKSLLESRHRDKSSSTTEEATNLNNLIPKFDNTNDGIETQFSEFNYQLQIDVLDELIKRRKAHDSQSTFAKIGQAAQAGGVAVVKVLKNLGTVINYVQAGLGGGNQNHTAKPGAKLPAVENQGGGWFKRLFGYGKGPAADKVAKDAADKAAKEATTPIPTAAEPAAKSATAKQAAQPAAAAKQAAQPAAAAKSAAQPAAAAKSAAKSDTALIPTIKEAVASVDTSNVNPNSLFGGYSSLFDDNSDLSAAKPKTAAAQTDAERQNEVNLRNKNILQNLEIGN